MGTHTGNLAINPAGLRAAAPAVDDLAAALLRALALHAAAADQQGRCWGRTECGRVFGDSYLPAAGQVRGELARLAQGMAGIAASLRQAAGAAEAADARAQARLG